MKYSTRLVAITCFLLPLTLTAQQNLTLIQGNFNKDKVRTAILFDVQHGEKIECSSSRVTETGEFSFALTNIKKGFYYLTDQNKRNFTRLYLKPGDKIRLQIDENGYELTQSTPENKVLKQWDDLAYAVTRMSVFPRKDTVTYHTFFPDLTALVSKAGAFKTKINTPDKDFNNFFKKSIDLEIEHAALKFLFSPNTKHPTKEEHPSYYAAVYNPEKYKDGTILKLGFGAEMVGLYNMFTLTKTGPYDPKNRKSILEQTENLGNDTVKGLFVAQHLARFKSLEEFNREIDPAKQFLLTDSMQARYFRALKKLSSYKKGDEAFNFSYPDVNGNIVSMKDLKGKVVLVDVWATWCGPCKAEIPHLKKLEEELKDRNIAFVSISVDEEKDKEKWLKFIEKEKLGGIQLFAKGWNDITRFYDITGIPRFMIFDQEGKIVTVDSPRPSAPELKELLVKIEEKATF